MDIGPINKLLNDLDSRIGSERAKHDEALRPDLQKKGISGSAVIPNLDAHERWLRMRSEIKRDLQEDIKERLKSLPSS